ncbi:MAG TPA: PHP domain-containing protein [Symbiobacteriaceae bacterium]|nr:PHP domain-containing protein [Symbiobacteriaceae bacterium]
MRSDPFTGRYLFHLHTTFTDGQASVQEYVELATRSQLDRLIFLEHIRAQPGYDVGQFIAEVRRCAAAFGVPALVGFEAKVLPGGGLDIAEEHAGMAEVLGLAEHGFPGDRELWRSSVLRALETYAAKDGGRPLVWVHPGLWLRKQGLLEAREREYLELLGIAQDLGVKVESNLRYGLVPGHLRDAVRPESLVFGADAHRLQDAEAAIAKLPRGW